MVNNEILLDIRDLHVSYGAVTAIKGISLHVKNYIWTFKSKIRKYYF